MKKRVLAALFTSCLVGMTVMGCSNGQKEETSGTAMEQTSEAAKSQETTTTGADQNKEPVVLRFSWWGGDDRAAATLEVIDQFEKLYPHISIEGEYGGSDGYSDKLATQLASGTAPDIIQIDPGVMPSFVNSGMEYFLDYTDYGFDFSNFEETYYKQQINGCFDGKQYGIPTGIAGCALIVNQDLADAIGIDFSNQYTWDDLLEWGKKVREYDDSMYLMSINKESLANILVNAYAKQLTGKTFIDEETKEMNFTKEDYENIYSYVQALYENEVIPPASYMASYSGDNMQSDPNWIAGKYVCSMTYTSLVEVMSAANESVNYTAGKLPVMEGAISESWFANCPQIITVSAKSEYPEEAMLFVDYFFNNETAMETLGCTRSVPPTAKARQICVASGSLGELLSAAADISGSYDGMLDDKYFQTQEAKQVIIDEVEAVGYGVNSPETAAKETLELLGNYVEGIR